MRNDSERREFINNDENWKTIEQTCFTQTQELKYCGYNWIRIRVAEWAYYWDARTRQNGHRFIWAIKGYYKIEELHGCLDPISKTQLLEEIKEIDWKGE